MTSGTGARISGSLFAGLLLWGGLAKPAFAQELTHRYNFNTPDDGVTVMDQVGSAHGTLLGTGTFDGNGGLSLTGVDGFVDLGASLIDGYSSVTFEAWVDCGVSSAWARLFDIGDTDPITGKGCYGLDFIVLNGSGSAQFEVFDTNPGYDHAPGLTFSPSPNGQGKTHIVISYDPQAPLTSIYVNGALKASGTNINIPLSSLVNAHSYLGRSGYNGDPYLNATIDEFRIYNGVLAADRVAVNSASGPDAIVSDPGALKSIQLTLPSPIYVEQKGIQVVLKGDYDNVKGVNLAFGNPTLQSGNSDILAVSGNMLLEAKATGTTTLIASYGGFSVTQTVAVIDYPATITHRYKFDESSGSTSFADSVGTAQGTVIGTASLDGNGHLVLPGNGTENYADLPGHLIDGYDALTFEFWVNIGTNPTWGRLVDFGDTSESGAGQNYVSFTPHSGFSPSGANFEVNGASGTEYMNVSPILDGRNLHLVLVYNPLNHTLSSYTNGALMGLKTGITTPMSAIVNTHSWLGRSSYIADQCGVATLDEFRMYNGALSPFRVALNAASGPNTFIDEPGILTNLHLTISSQASLDQQVPVAVTGDYVNVQGLNLAFAKPTLKSGNTNIVVVNGDLSLTAVGAGTTTVTASYGGLSTTENITVIDAYPAVLKHRYSFNETAGSTTFADSVGTAAGTVIGTANLDGNGHLVLPGGGTEDYADLPGHLIEGYDVVTFEFWVEVGANPTWGRLLDFGDTSESGAGQYYISFTPHSGFTPNGANFEVNGPNGTENLNVAPILDGQNLHLTLIFNPSLQTLAMYTNAVLMGKMSNVTTPMASLVINHCWLGRSSYIADQCGVDVIDEFRIYNGVLNSKRIAANFAAGPGTIPIDEPKPQLMITKNGTTVILTWPNPSTGYTVETSSTLGGSASWGPLPDALNPTVVNGMNQITMPIGAKTAFYRLIK